jgi:hypothetical protein
MRRPGVDRARGRVTPDARPGPSLRCASATRGLFVVFAAGAGLPRRLGTSTDYQVSTRASPGKRPHGGFCTFYVAKRPA